MTIKELADKHKNDIAKCNGVTEKAVLMEVFAPRRNLLREYKGRGFALWTPTRIKLAFEYGSGTMDDVIRYARTNKAYLTMIDLEKGKIIS